MDLGPDSHPPPIARSKTPPRPLRETLRIRRGRYPAEIAEGAEDNWEGGLQIHPTFFLQLLWSAENCFPPPRRMYLGLDSQHPPWPGRKRHCALCGRLSGSGWGGIPQRSQRAQRGIGRWGLQIHRTFFLQLLWSAENCFPIILPKGVCIWALTLNTLHGQVENATASSAGDSPDPFILDSAGMFRLYKKLTIGFCCW
jgi:hypothetical protein